MGSDVRLTSGNTVIPLRIATDSESKALAYREENIIGPDVINPADGQQFLDVFDTWHRGGFVSEHVQNGLYNEAVNVDCTMPGEIKPGPRRITTIDCGNGVDLDHYGISGLFFDPISNLVCALVKKENAAVDDIPNRVDIKWIDSSHTFPLVGVIATQDATLDATAVDYAGRTGFTNAARPLQRLRGGNWEIIYPFGDGYRSFDIDALGPAVAVNCHEIIVAGNRGYKVSLEANGELGLSNINLNADWTVALNWTSPVLLQDQDTVQSSVAATEINVGVSLAAVGETPYVGASRGVFSLGSGGVPFNLFPVLVKTAPGFANAWPITPAAGGLVMGLYGPGILVWFTQTFGTQIGPSTNPLSKPDNCKVMHLQESPANGDLWALVWFPERANADGVWEMWVGKKTSGTRPGPGAYAWHPLLRDLNAVEGGPNNTQSNLRRHGLYRPFLPFMFSPSSFPVPSDPAELAIATGHSPLGDSGTANAAVTTTNTTLTDTRVSWTTDEWVGYRVTCSGKTLLVSGNTATVLTGDSWSGGGNPGNGKAWQLALGRSRLTFVSGGLFYDLADYNHEDRSASGYGNLVVQWRSGRYSRHDRRVSRHWTELRFLGKNLGTAGNNGGRIQVEISFDGGAFENPPAGVTYLTSDAQTVLFDTSARDIEIRLTWQLDGAGTMNTAPATITQIDYVGREVPPTLLRINLVVEATSPQQAGGVRRHEAASDLYSTLVNLVDDAKMTFNDPFGVDRTVIVLPVQPLTAGEVHGVMVPEGAIGVSLLEVN